MRREAARMGFSLLGVSYIGTLPTSASVSAI
jgi:hypothetical protein